MNTLKALGRGGRLVQVMLAWSSLSLIGASIQLAYEVINGIPFIR